MSTPGRYSQAQDKDGAAAELERCDIKITPSARSLCCWHQAHRQTTGDTTLLTSALRVALMSTSRRSFLTAAKSRRMMIRKSESTVRSCTCVGVAIKERCTTLLQPLVSRVLSHGRVDRHLKKAARPSAHLRATRASNMARHGATVVLLSQVLTINPGATWRRGVERLIFLIEPHEEFEYKSLLKMRHRHRLTLADERVSSRCGQLGYLVQYHVRNAFQLWVSL